MCRHVTFQTAVGCKQGLTEHAFVVFDPGVNPDVGFKDAVGHERSPALVTFIGLFS